MIHKIINDIATKAVILHINFEQHLQDVQPVSVISIQVWTLGISASLRGNHRV